MDALFKPMDSDLNDNQMFYFKYENCCADPIQNAIPNHTTTPRWIFIKK